MNEKLEKLKENFISEKPFKKTNEDKLFEKVKEFEERLKVLEKELKKTEEQLEKANNFIRRFIPAFPSSINRYNLIYIKERIEEDLKND